ncbi:MAG: D-alanine--D-alanine ligase [Nitrospira bacterium HGW-Nitrospira-1]|nr:MAG: D-alanine--D-alanine ligase [Nitrospira bacterium HGW-Nitrospira-1]
MNKNDLRKKKIGVLMGGSSAEREVSLKSGQAVYNSLRSLKYNVAAIDAGEDLCMVLKKQKIDIAFIALHGGHGENGAVQGMLEIMGIPYTGSGVLASALAMDKEASKKVFLYHNIPVPAFKIVMRDELRVMGKKSGGSSVSSPITHHSLPPFPLPWVIKPATEGSSVGVEIVKDKSALKAALQKAFSYGEKVVVEQYISGKEVQIGVLNNKALGGVEVRPSLEFYNYEAKYTAGLTEYILPPQLRRKAYAGAKNIGLAAHKALGCSGATRVDLIIDTNGNPFVLEVNTIPGMTETSLLPKIAKNAGIGFGELLRRILEGIR